MIVIVIVIVKQAQETNFLKLNIDGRSRRHLFVSVSSFPDSSMTACLKAQAGHPWLRQGFSKSTDGTAVFCGLGSSVGLLNAGSSLVYTLQ